MPIVKENWSVEKLNGTSFCSKCGKALNHGDRTFANYLQLFRYCIPCGHGVGLRIVSEDSKGNKV